MKIEKIHNFEDSQKIEESNFSIQDNFYLKHFGHLPERVDFEKFPEIQKKDIDLYITNKSGERKSVSEKFRPENHSDICFEIYSIYSTKVGWACESEADLLCYFLPDTAVVLQMDKIVEILKRNKITKQIDDINEQLKYKDIWIDGETYFVPVIKALNKGYFSLSIAFNEKQLKRMGVRHTVFQLP
jgi:hypothetical protein